MVKASTRAQYSGHHPGVRFTCFMLPILLIGLVLSALLGWWWADSLAGVIMAPIITKEGVEALRCKSYDGCA